MGQGRAVCADCAHRTKPAARRPALDARDPRSYHMG